MPLWARRVPHPSPTCTPQGQGMRNGEGVVSLGRARPDTWFCKQNEGTDESACIAMGLQAGAAGGGREAGRGGIQQEEEQSILHGKGERTHLPFNSSVFCGPEVRSHLLVPQRLSLA